MEVLSPVRSMKDIFGLISRSPFPDLKLGGIQARSSWPAYVAVGRKSSCRAFVVLPSVRHLPRYPQDYILHILPKTLRYILFPHVHMSFCSASGIPENICSVLSLLFSILGEAIDLSGATNESKRGANRAREPPHSWPEFVGAWG